MDVIHMPTEEEIQAEIAQKGVYLYCQLSVKHSCSSRKEEFAQAGCT